MNSQQRVSPTFGNAEGGRSGWWFGCDPLAFPGCMDWRGMLSNAGRAFIGNLES